MSEVESRVDWQEWQVSITDKGRAYLASFPKWWQFWKRAYTFEEFDVLWEQMQQEKQAGQSVSS